MPIVTNSGGGTLSYLVHGNRSARHAILWMHGVMSSRYEVLSVKQETLEALDAFVIGIDRPGYGKSPARRKGRTYWDFVKDVEALADSLDIKQYFVLGVSGGGPYALACAALTPDRVLGILMISSAGYPGWLTPAQRKDATSSGRSWLAGCLRSAIIHPSFSSALCWLGETLVGSVLLFHLLVKPLTERSLQLTLQQCKALGTFGMFVHKESQSCLGVALALGARCTRWRLHAQVALSLGTWQAMTERDRHCLEHNHPEYLQLVRPESLRQGTATGLVQDLHLYTCPWSFSPAAIPPALQRSTFIWHGTDDLQVSVHYAHAFKLHMPDASLEIVEDGGHFHYFVCDEARQFEALSRVLKSGSQ